MDLNVSVFPNIFYKLLTVLQLLVDWPAPLMKTIFKSHKIFFAVVQIFLYLNVDGNECVLYIMNFAEG